MFMRFVKLWGGFGNQMFQYAFGMYLEQQRNEPIGYYQIDAGENDRSLGLMKFKVNLWIPGQVEIKKHFIFTGEGILYRAERKMLKLFPGLNTSIFIEPGPEYIPVIPDQVILFDGYWQSYKYIQPVEQKLRDQFVFRDIPMVHENTLKDIEGSNSISLHIRRGDYLSGRMKRMYDTCSKEYYSRAIEISSKSSTDWKVFVFSDDIKWSAEFLNLKKDRVVYVDSREYPDPQCMDLYLMSKCKNNIIANSTFSWWAAWLNSNPDKIVIAPSKWYRGKLNDFTNDLIPDKWIRV